MFPDRVVSTPPRPLLQFLDPSGSGAELQPLASPEADTLALWSQDSFAGQLDPQEQLLPSTEAAVPELASVVQALARTLTQLTRLALRLFTGAPQGDLQGTTDSPQGGPQGQADGPRGQSSDGDHRTRGHRDGHRSRSHRSGHRDSPRHHGSHHASHHMRHDSPHHEARHPSRSRHPSPANDTQGLHGVGTPGTTNKSKLEFAKRVAHKFGLTITSTTGGQHAPGSYHYRGRAIDVAGPPAAMARFFRFFAHYKPTELFYDPIGAIKNGNRIPPIGGHSDHVHVAF